MHYFNVNVPEGVVFHLISDYCENLCLRAFNASLKLGLFSMHIFCYLFHQI